MRCSAYTKNMVLYLIICLGNIKSLANNLSTWVLVRFINRKNYCYENLFYEHDIYLWMFSGDLLYYGGVEWLNISDFLGKIKKGLELHAMCFVFKSAVVFLCKERLRQKKKLMVCYTKQDFYNNNLNISISLFQFKNV